VNLFKAQIAAGGPVTVTDPEMERYFMTIPEAVQLVLQAAALGAGGEVFVLDMGEPVRIVDLATDLIRLSGLRPRVGPDGAEKRGVGPAAEGEDGTGEDWDIEVIFTGARPGEKLYEELFGAAEVYGRTRHEKILVALNGKDEHNLLTAQVERLIDAARQGDEAVVGRLLRAIVPEYRPLDGRRGEEERADHGAWTPAMVIEAAGD
jgi:FlaA1/EpsC-like NDP-sugar epimerase